MAWQFVGAKVNQPLSPPEPLPSTSLTSLLPFLGLPELIPEHRRLADAVTPAQEHEFDLAQRVLMALDIIEHGCPVAADRGLRLIVAGRASSHTVLITALCRHYMGRTRDAFQLLLDHHHPIFDYQLACCAADLGWAPVALQRLALARDKTPSVATRAIVDVDFRGLWGHFRSGAATLEECHLLCGASFDLLRAQAENPSSLPFEFLDHFDYAELPDELRQVVRLAPLLVVFKQACKTDEDKHALESWWRDRVATAAVLFGEASISAHAKVIGAQIGYAEAAAERGDMMAARWHCQYVLDLDPRQISNLLERARHPELRALLEGYHKVHTAAPGFFKEFEQAMKDHSAERALAALSGLPDSLLGNPWIEHRHSRILRVLGRHAASLRALLAVMAGWPDDAMPYFNSVVELADLGQWDAAELILEHVPESFWRVKRTARLSEKLAQRDATKINAAGTFREFRGEPDLAGEIELPVRP